MFMQNILTVSSLWFSTDLCQNSTSKTPDPRPGQQRDKSNTATWKEAPPHIYWLPAFVLSVTSAMEMINLLSDLILLLFIS